MKEAPLPSDESRKRRWLIRLLGIVAILLIVLLLVAPSIIAKTGLRDKLINNLLGPTNLSASTEGATFGWFSPLTAEGIQVEGVRRHFELHVDRIAAEQTLLGLLASSPELGEITIEKPHARVVLPLDLPAETNPQLPSPIFTAHVKDAGLTVSNSDSTKPIIDVDGFNVTVRVKQGAEGQVLAVDPVEVFTNKKLTPELCSKLLHLMSPSMHDATEVEGEFSLALDKLSIPLGIAEEQLAEKTEVAGVLTLHQVSVNAQSPMLEAVVKLLADMNKTEVPEKVRLAKDATIQFRVEGGRLYHDGLELSVPEIAPELKVRSSGSVGLDGTLDLQLELPHLDEVKRREAGPVLCHISGTLDEPQLSVKNAALVLRVPQHAQPLIDLDGINLVMHVQGPPTSRVLDIEPFEVFKRANITQELARGLIEIIAPSIDYTTNLSGEISLSFEALQIPLGASPQELLRGLKLRGRLGIHEVTTESNNPTLQAIVRLLADLYGKDPGDVVRIAHNTEFDFNLEDGRLTYDGLSLGFPDIDPALVVTSRGSVGLDETIYLKLDLPRLDKAKAAQLGPVECQITGTLSEPVLTVKNASLVVRLHESELPLLDIDSVDLKMQVETREDGQTLVADPFKIFDQHRIVAARSDQLLSLLAPSLGDLTDVEGEITLTIEEFRAPLGRPRAELIRDLVLAGRFQLHDVSTTIETPLASTVVKALANLYEKDPPEVARVIKDADVPFQLRDGRLYQDEMRIGFPDISPELMGKLRGSVGLDRTLDLTLEVPSVLSRIQNASEKVKAEMIRMKITGTIDDPLVEEIKD